MPKERMHIVAFQYGLRDIPTVANRGVEILVKMFNLFYMTEAWCTEGLSGSRGLDFHLAQHPSQPAELRSKHRSGRGRNPRPRA